MRKVIYRLGLGIITLLVMHQQGISQVGYTPGQIQEMEAAKQLQAAAMIQAGNYSQKSFRPEQDCESAILVCQSVYSYSQPFNGAGNTPNEVNQSIACLSAAEVNSVWYKFRANTSGTLNFTLTPNLPTDDYDWAVYNISHASCGEIFTDGILQVGCNFSSIPGSTGPNGNLGVQNTAAINVAAGDVFVIVVSRFTPVSTEGFSLDFSASTAFIYDTIPPVVIAADYVCDNYGLRLTTDKFMTCSSIAADGSDFTAIDAQGNSIPVLGAVGVGCANGETLTYQVDVKLAAQTSDIQATINLQQGTDGNTIGGACMHWMNQINITSLLAAKPVLNAGDDHQTCTYWPYYPLLTATNQWETFQWYKNGQEIQGQTANTFQPDGGGTYTVVGTKGQGSVFCNYTDTVVIDVDVKYCENSLPSAFTPNGDGVNDVYLKKADMTIINRWGQTLFQGLGGWDGTYLGLPVENGTYYVIFKFTDGSGEEKIIKEPVTLIR